MADVFWIGGAPATFDIWTATVGGTVEATDIFIVTINGKSLSVVAGSTSTATVAGTIATAFNAVDSSVYPEFAEYAAQAVGSTVVFTANTIGVPGTISVSTTETGGGTADDQTFAIVNTQAATGPNHANNAANWLGGSLPTGSDIAWIQDTNVSLLFGLDFIGGTIAANADLRVMQSFEGVIGLPRYNANGYFEYRDQYLKWTLDSIEIGGGPGGNGSNLIRIFGGTSSTLKIFNTGTPLGNDLSAVNVYSTTISNLQVYAGTVGIGQNLEATTVTVASLAGGNTYFGKNVTLATSQAMAGNANVIMDCNQVGTMTMTGSGTLTTYGTIATVNVYNGSLDVRGTGGTGSTIIGGQGRVSLANATASVTRTGGITMLQGAQFLDPNSRLATSTNIAFTGCDPTTTTCNFGPARTMAFSV
jgi:hypothetical protein